MARPNLAEQFVILLRVGIWVLIKEKEYFLSFEDFPYFKDQTLNSIQNVQLPQGYHLYWPDLDIDLEIDNLENPEKYPLKSAIQKKRSNHSHSRAAARS
ncbi:MAG TPA: integron cassette protein [Candidatus Aminicenantes bacterium]|nr:integron cassette protein [Candidatus Aminicenantes bacterium]